MSQLLHRTLFLLFLVFFLPISGQLPAQSAANAFSVTDESAQPVRALRQRAGQGDANAQFELARRLYLGAGMAQDVQAAEALFLQAAVAGHPEAQLKLGLLSERAIGRPWDYDEALKWYRLAAGQGNQVAQYKLGMLYDFESQVITRRTGPHSTFTGSAVTNDAVMAGDWFRRAAKQGYGPALFRLSILEYGRQLPGRPSEGLAGSNPDEAHRHLEEAALLGVPEAMTSLAMKNTSFLGGTADWVQAYRWALVGRTSSGQQQFSIIPMLEQKMTPAQITEARKLAAETKFPSARADVLRWHELVSLQNPGPPSLAPANSTNIFQKLLADAEKGIPSAGFNLALCLQHDSYFSQENQRQSIPAANGAGLSGMPGSTVILNQTETRDGRALKWFTLAADQGHRDAQYHLAWMYLNGRGTDEDKLKARHYFQLAARQNHIPAKYQLALLMEQEVGGPKVMTEITRLLREAAEAGHPDAARKLAVLMPGAGVKPVSPVASPAKSVAASHRSRLAILALNGELKPAADLLIASLSADPKMELVDRQELDRIIREQALSALKTADLGRLGHLLRADGILLLQQFAQSGKPFAEVRLLATGPGVTVSQWVYPMPLADPVTWSRMMTRQLSPYLAKLQVPPDNTVPLSILNLRSAVSSPQSKEQERQMTFLLIHRLLSVPEIFVLERQRLDRLAEEKQLAGAGTEPFWNGSYLLDGVINRDGEVPGKVTIHARLVSRQSQTNEVFVSGSAADLSAVVEQLAIKLIPFLHQTGQAPPWNPAEEAAQYFEEARWAMKWNMLREAQQASEASWALGLRLDELRQLRVAAYQKDAETKPGTVYIFDQRFEKAELPPDPAKLDILIRAMDLYLESSTSAQFQTLQTNQPAWVATGVDLLQRSTQILQHYYLSRASRIASAEKLAAARGRTRELVAFLADLVVISESVWQERFYEQLLTRNSLWEENAAEATQALERYLTRGYINSCLKFKSIYRNPLVQGFWCDWSAGPVKTDSEKLNRMLENLCGTAPVSQRFDACAAGAILARNEADFVRWFGRLIDLRLQNQDAVIRREIDDSQWAPVNSYWSSGRHHFNMALFQKLPAAAAEEFKTKQQRMQSITVERDKHAVANTATANDRRVEQTYRALKAILQSSAEIPIAERSQYYIAAFTFEQARDLLALLPEYEKRIKSGKSLGMKGSMDALRFHLEHITAKGKQSYE